MTTSPNDVVSLAARAAETARKNRGDRQRWSAVARLAMAGAQGTSALIVVRRSQGFERVGQAGAVDHHWAEQLFAQAMMQRDVVVELTGTAGSLGQITPHYAAVAFGVEGSELSGVIAVARTEPSPLSVDQRENLALLASSMFALFAPSLPADEASGSTPNDIVAELFAQSPAPTLVYERNQSSNELCLLSANEAFLANFSLHAKPADTLPLRYLSGERSDAEILSAIHEAALLGRAMRAVIALYPPKTDGFRWCEISGYAVNLASGQQLWIEQFHDLTERIAQQQAIRADRNRLQGTLGSMADAVITLDALGRLRFMNYAARVLLDVGRVVDADRLVQADERLLQLRDIETEAPLTAPFTLTAASNQARKARALVMTRTGGRRYVEYVVSVIERAGGVTDGVVVLLRDVTAEEVLTRQLSFEASHDQLTGIANRRRFDQALARALASAKAETQQHTLAFLDLDRFKAINDSCGHAAGDQVLREIAQLFKGQLRSHDVIARFGGDEFAILMHDCSPKTASRVINRIRAAIAMYRWHWQSRDYTLGVSIGLAEITQASPDVDHLLREADAACYADKATHHNHERHLPTVTGDKPVTTPRISWTR